MAQTLVLFRTEDELIIVKLCHSAEANLAAYPSPVQDMRIEAEQKLGDDQYYDVPFDPHAAACLHQAEPPADEGLLAVRR